LIELVADQHTTPLDSSAPAGASRLGRSGGLVYFVGRTAELGTELWASDGTTAGTRLVKDIEPGKRGSFPSRPFDANGIAYFAASDDVHGTELWRSDGTAAGTRLVADLDPGPRGSNPHDFVVAGGIVYFAATDALHGQELWRTDGTRAGTRRVADIRPGPERSAPSQLTASGDRIFFQADDGTHGPELWVSDGTAAGTRLALDILPGPGGALDRDRLPGQGNFPRRPFVVLGGNVYFEADDGVHGAELWRSDGTAAGTVLVRDHRPGPGSGGVYPRIAFDGRIVFTVSNNGSLPPAAPELWTTDGTDAGTFQLAASGTRRHEPLVEVGGRLFFVASSASNYDKDHELWVTDGTPAGTVMLRDVLVPSRCANHTVGQLTVVGNRVFFVAREPGHDEEVWVTDGTVAGTRRVADIMPGYGSNPLHLTALGNLLLFTADDLQHGQELWVTDGTAAATTMLVDLFQGTTDFFGYYDESTPLVPLGNQVFYLGDRPFESTTRLYHSDGTPSGTGIVPGLESVEIEPVGGDPLGQRLAAAGGNVFFLSDDSELWRTNGTASGAVRIHDFGASTTGFAQLVPVGSTVYVVPGTLVNVGAELWKTDGTTATLVADIVPGGASSSPRILGSVGSTVFFAAADSQHGYELWATDGTAAGTHLVRDIRPGQAESLGLYDTNHAASGSLFFFIANDGVHGRELWRSDGTEAGTFMLVDSPSGEELPSGNSAWITPLPRGRVLVSREGPDFEAPDELWVSDGTSLGTRKIESFAQRLSYDPGFVSLDGVVYFVVEEIDQIFEDGNYSTKDVLWRSDGTDSGTRRVVDPGSRQIIGLTAVDGRLYFGVGSGFLWVSDGTADGTSLLAPLDGDFGQLQERTLAAADGRLFLVADDRVHGNELWTVSCGNGIVEYDEECDAGASNGSGSCSATCEGTGGRGAGWLAGLRDGPGGSPPSRNGRPIRLPQR
jgi:ELWxxDGT repeat protein